DDTPAICAALARALPIEVGDQPCKVCIVEESLCNADKCVPTGNERSRAAQHRMWCVAVIAASCSGSGQACRVVLACFRLGYEGWSLIGSSVVINNFERGQDCH